MATIRRLSKGQITDFVLFVLTVCWRNLVCRLDEWTLGSVICTFGRSKTWSNVLALSTAAQEVHHHSQVIYFLILKENHIGHLLHNISHINHFVLNQPVAHQNLFALEVSQLVKMVFVIFKFLKALKHLGEKFVHCDDVFLFAIDSIIHDYLIISSTLCQGIGHFEHMVLSIHDIGVQWSVHVLSCPQFDALLKVFALHDHLQEMRVLNDILVMFHFENVIFLFCDEVLKTVFDRFGCTSTEPYMPQSLLLIFSKFKNARSRQNKKWNHKRAPESCKHGNPFAHGGIWSIITIADGSNGHDQEPDWVEIIVKKRCLNVVLIVSVVWNFKDSHYIGQDEHSAGKQDQHKGSWVVFKLAFVAKSNSWSEAIVLTDLFRISICIDTIVDKGPIHEKEPQKHKNEKPIAQEVQQNIIMNSSWLISVFNYDELLVKWKRKNE